MDMTTEEYIDKLNDIQSVPVSNFTLNPNIEPRFIIDLNTRKIKIPEEFSFLGVLNDSSAETIYFQMDRYFDGKDLSQYTIIVQFAITDKNRNLNEGFSPVTEIDTETIPNKIIFGWTITNEVTSFTGDVAFSVRIYEIEDVKTDFDSMSVFSYCLNTLPSILPVKETLNVSNNISVNYPSYLEEWNQRMQDLDKKISTSYEDVQTEVNKANEILENIKTNGEQIVTEINTATVDAKNQIGQTASDALKSIAQANSKLPTITNDDARKSVTIKSDASGYEYTGPYAPIECAIIPTASGNPAGCNDAIKWNFQGLRIYGKSTQNGTPSLDNPIQIVNAGDSGSISLTITDGEDQNQTLVISTSSGLPGIPVDSGGNYTDKSGQQWICDEIDFDRGLYIQNIKRLTSSDLLAKKVDSASNTWVYIDSISDIRIVKVWKNYNVGAALCSHFSFITENFPPTAGTFALWEADYGGTTRGSRLAFGFDSVDSFRTFLEQNDITLFYATSIPIEKPLSPEELAAYRALTTYDSTTVVSTAEPVAGIEFDYIANTKDYIDKKISEAVTAAITLAQGGN